MEWRGTILGALRIGLASARANLVPMVVLGFLAAMTAFGYYFIPGASSLLEPVRCWQEECGPIAAFLNRLIFCGVIPGALMVSIKSIRPAFPTRVLIAQVLWCGVWGVICDRMYIAVDMIFGSGRNLLSIFVKTAFDQLPWTVLVVMPCNAAFYFWLARGFSLGRTVSDWPRGRFWQTLVLPFVVTNWCVWIPVTVAVFALPLALRVQISGLASSYWTLVCLHLGRSATRDC